MKSDKKMIEEMDRIVAEGSEAEHFKPARVRVSRNLRVVYTVRLSPDELERFSAAAAERSMTVSDFLRSSAQAAILGDVDLESAAAWLEIRQKVDELNDAVTRLSQAG